MVELEPEERIYQSIRDCSYDVNQINLPRTEEYLDYNGEKLHLRSYWPSSPPKAIVLFIHGYISHINRPTHGYLGPLFTSRDIAYVGFDFPGHGYSTGERALVVPVDELVKISIRVIEIIFSEENRNHSYHIQRNGQVKRDTPLFLLGHSMGGAIALLVGKELRSHLASQYRFLGTVFLCPALKIMTLPPAVRFLLDWILAPLFPSTSIPESVNRTHNPRTTWNNDDYIRYVKADHYPANPNGLGWELTTKFASVSMLFALAETASSHMSSIDYPWLMFHDPDDKTVDFEGAKLMHEACKTTEQYKKLVVLENGGHDILINRLGTISRQTIEWIESIVSASAAAVKE